jgi:Fe-S oxidoreductase
MEEAYIVEMKQKIFDAVRKCRICISCYNDCPLQESTTGFVTQGPTGITKSLYYGILWDALKGKDAEDLRDILYRCTTCGSCVNRCRKSACGIDVVGVIEAGRQFLVEKMIGPLPDQVKALEALDQEKNPYGELAEKRTQWLEAIDPQEAQKVKVLADGAKAENLLFVGCTCSYDPDLIKMPEALVKVLNCAGLDYGIMKDEGCCGDPALRIGEAGLFEELAGGNVEKIANCGAGRVINACPHGYHTLQNNYTDWENKPEVQHYTQAFADYLTQGKLQVKKKIDRRVTFHDPCYLGKRNNIYDAPRVILDKIAGDRFVEMKRNRADSLCCGGGGGRMFAEIEETTRLSELRVRHALEVGAEIIATACPWCYIQLSDGIKTSGNEGKIEVRDLADLLAECL